MSVWATAPEALPTQVSYEAQRYMALGRIPAIPLINVFTILNSATAGQSCLLTSKAIVVPLSASMVCEEHCPRWHSLRHRFHGRALTRYHPSGRTAWEPLYGRQAPNGFERQAPLLHSNVQPVTFFAHCPFRVRIFLSF